MKPSFDLLKFIDRLHIGYLALLPVVATAALIATYGTSEPYVVFFVGVAAVGIYLAVIGSFTPRPGSVLAGLWMLLDGPMWVLFSALAGKQASSIFIESFLVDGLAIYLSILFLSITSDLPTPGQRSGSIGIALATSALVLWMSWPYLLANVLQEPLRLILLTAGCLEGLFFRYRSLRDERVHRTGDNPALLGGMVMLWCLVLFASIAISQN